MVAQVRRRSLGDHRLRPGVEHDAAVGDGVDALELVCHDDERDAEASRELTDRLVEAGRGDRIQAGRRLVQEEDPGIQRHGPGDARALLHSPREGGRLLRGGREQADLVELGRGDEILLLGAEVRELVEREADVLEHGHRAEERAALVHHAELAQQAESVLALGGHDVLAVEEDPARGRPVEADHDLQKRALPAARTAEDHEDLAAPDLERDVLLDHVVAVGDRDVLDRDDDRRCGAHMCSTYVRTAKTSRRR